MERGGAEGVASAVTEDNYMYTVISCMRGEGEGGREGGGERSRRELTYNACLVRTLRILSA